MAGDLFHAIVDGLVNAANSAIASAPTTRDDINTPRLVSIDPVFAESQPRTLLPPGDATYSSRPGMLDAGFGHGGGVVACLTGGEGRALAIHDDGSIAVVGVSSNDFGHPSMTIARYDRTGKPLRSFGKTGCIRLDLAYPSGARTDSTAAAVVVQPDGCVVIAGAAQQPPSAPGFHNDIVLTRLTPDGRLDPSFGAGGWLQLRLGLASAANSLILESDGRILAAGYVRNLKGGNFQVLLLRLMPTGAPDPSFGGNGFVILPGTSEVEQIVAIARHQQSGKTIGVANEENGYDKKFIFFRVDFEGRLDSTFGNAGRRQFDSGGNVLGGLAIQPDGKPVAAGYLADRQYFLVRLLGDGSPDPAFGERGIVHGRFDGSTSVAPSFGTAVAVSADGSIILGGSLTGKTNTAFALSRFLPTGEPDVGFGDGGTALIEPAVGSNWVRALALDGDAIVAAGQSSGSIALLRFTARADDPPAAQRDSEPASAPRRREGGWLDTTFGNGGAVFGDFKPDPAEASALVVQPDGSVVIVGSVGNPDDPTGRNLGLLRIDERGAVDSSFGDRGYKVLDVEGNDNVARAVALQRDGKLIVAGEILDRQQGAYQFALVRLDANGRLDASFGGGVVVPRFQYRTDSRAYAVTIQSDGRIVAAGHSTYACDATDQSNGKVRPELLDNEWFAIARYNDDGTLDKSFGIGGTQETLMALGSGARARARALQVLGDGSIVTCGYSRSNTSGRAREVALESHTADGQHDMTFGFKGVAYLTLEGGDEVASALAVQPDRKLVLAGESAPDENSAQHFMLARLKPDGELDPTFNHTGFVINKQFAGVARSVIILPDGRIIAAGSAIVTNNGAATREQVALVSYLSDGSVDENFGASGVLFIDLGGDNDGAEAIAMTGEKILVAATTRVGQTSSFALVRVHTY